MEVLALSDSGEYCRDESARRPLVSVVIPTYNSSGVVSRALHSLERQTFTDFEVVIADSARSTDDLPRRIAAYNKFPLCVVTGVRGKGADGRNVGWQAARGRYVAFLDSDDEFLPSKLATCVASLEQGWADVVYSQVFVERGVGRLWIKPWRGVVEGENIYDYLLVDRGWVQTSTVVLAREWYRRFRFDERLSFGDDMQFAVDAVRSGARLKMIEEPLVVYYDLGTAQQLSQEPNVGPGADNPFNPFLGWLERQRIFMPKRAYIGAQATIFSRFHARHHPGRALAYIIQGYLSGALSGTKAARQALMSFAPGLYRSLCNGVARWRGIDVVELLEYFDGSAARLVDTSAGEIKNSQQVVRPLPCLSDSLTGPPPAERYCGARPLSSSRAPSGSRSLMSCKSVLHVGQGLTSLDSTPSPGPGLPLRHS